MTIQVDDLNTREKSTMRPWLKLCEHLAGKTTGIMALSSAVLYAVAGPAAVIPVVVWGMDCYHFFSNAQIDEQIETALKAGNIEQLDTLKSRFNKGISEMQMEYLLVNSLINKDKKVIPWMIAQGYKPSRDRVLAVYKQLPHPIFLETLSFWSLFQHNIIARTLAVYSMKNNLPDLLENLLSLECYRGDALIALSDEYTGNESGFLTCIARYAQYFVLDVEIIIFRIRNLDEQRQINFLEKVLSVFKSQDLPVHSLLLRIIDNPSFQQIIECWSQNNNLNLAQSLFRHCWNPAYPGQYPHFKNLRAHLLKHFPRLLDDASYARQLIQECFSREFGLDLFFIIQFFPKQCWSTDLVVLNAVDGYLFAELFGSRKRQDLVSNLADAGFDFSLTLGDREKLPRGVTREQITYRAILSYYDIDLPGDLEFAAIKQQKMLAMALGLRGNSEFFGVKNAQNSLVKIPHGGLAEPQIYWNHLIHFYKNGYSPGKQAERLSIQEDIHQVIDDLPKSHENIDVNQLVNSFNKNSPLILPIYLTCDFGSSHIATVGFLKVNDRHYLRVEADKGMGRHEFCVYVVLGHPKDTLSEYARSKSNFYRADKWASPRSQFENKIFTAPLKKQKDNFCGRISAEYAFHIVFFLGLMSNHLRDGDSEAIQRVCVTYYSRARAWFKEFKLSYKKQMVEDYAHQPKPYQNHRFFESAKAQLTKHEEAFTAEDLPLLRVSDQTHAF